MRAFVVLGALLGLVVAVGSVRGAPPIEDEWIRPSGAYAVIQPSDGSPPVTIDIEMDRGAPGRWPVPRVLLPSEDPGTLLFGFRSAVFQALPHTSEIQVSLGVARDEKIVPDSGEAPSAEGGPPVHRSDQASHLHDTSITWHTARPPLRVVPLSSWHIVLVGGYSIVEFELPESMLRDAGRVAVRLSVSRTDGPTCTNGGMPTVYLSPKAWIWQISDELVETDRPGEVWIWFDIDGAEASARRTPTDDVAHSRCVSLDPVFLIPTERMNATRSEEPGDAPPAAPNAAPIEVRFVGPRGDELFFGIVVDHAAVAHPCLVAGWLELRMPLDPHAEGAEVGAERLLARAPVTVGVSPDPGWTTNRSRALVSVFDAEGDEVRELRDFAHHGEDRDLRFILRADERIACLIRFERVMAPLEGDVLAFGTVSNRAAARRQAAQEEDR